MHVYGGFEQGPIRPPSEAASLLLRVNRNCPWNRCTFCSIYKKQKFSLRPVADVIADIDSIHRYISEMQQGGRSPESSVRPVSQEDHAAFYAARSWLAEGMESIFLQDADALVIRPENLITILRHIRKCFPGVQRITSYARSESVARISSEHMREFAEAGLNRIHIGMETASDTILGMVSKGATKAIHVAAGLKVKEAGIELSEYVLTGIGGSEFSRDHAVETADALNQINPDFIRFRTLHIQDKINLFANSEDKRYQWAPDLVLAEEILLLLQHLQGVTSTVKSDHSYNLFQEIDGVLPDDRERLMDVLRRFIRMSPAERALFQFGKRAGYFLRVGDMAANPGRTAQVSELLRKDGIVPENADQAIHDMIQERMRRGMPF